MVIDLYVDGSYNKCEPSATRGGSVVVINNKAVAAQMYKTDNAPLVKMNNVGGELFATICATSFVGALLNTLGQGNDANVIRLFYDYKGIKEFITGTPRWKAKQLGSIIYVKAMGMFADSYPNIQLEYHKVIAHTGDKWNDVADALANSVVPSDIRHLTVSSVGYDEE